MSKSNKEILSEVIEYVDGLCKEPNENPYPAVSNKKEWQENIEEFGGSDIQLVLVGDNPGTKEEQNSEYFSNDGQSGNSARSFLEMAAKYPNGSINEFNWVILNKTPYHTAKSKELKLDKDNKVIESMAKTVGFLNRFAEANEELVILIVGFSRYELNKAFFPILEKKAIESPKLASALHFAYHFSYGHFFKHWAQADFKGITNESGTTLFLNLYHISEKTNQRIKEYYKINFSLIRDINLMNDYYDSLLGKIRPGQLCPQEYDFLRDLLVKHSQDVLSLAEEFERSPRQFLNLNEEQLSNFSKFSRELSELKKKSKHLIRKGDYEEAANIRGQIIDKQSDLFNELVRLNGFNKTFNYFLGKLVIVPPEDHSELDVLRKVFEGTGF